MPKKYIAATNVKHSGVETPVGGTLDRNAFTDDEWDDLVGAGAVAGEAPEPIEDVAVTSETGKMLNPDDEE